MSGITGLSINQESYKDCFLEDLFWITGYQQHLGEEYSGLAVCDEGEMKIRTHRGLFRSAFTDDMAGLEGTEGIGYCGDAREPFSVNSRMGKLVICFSGNVQNRAELEQTFLSFGHSFSRDGDDIEIIAKLIAQGDGIIDGIKNMASQIKGAYSLVILNHEGIYATCCPTCHWPLVIGEKQGAIIIASDPGGFSNFGFAVTGDVEPGEIVFLQRGSIISREKMPVSKIQHCSFTWVYNNFPTALFNGIPVSAVRKRLGAALAKRDIEQGFIPDIVIPVPDSGRFCAIGYHQEFCRQANQGLIKRVPSYDELLIKYPYAGRSYIQPTQTERDLEAHVKQLKSGEDYTNLKAAVCDDSIRRGTQLQKTLVPKLRSLGIGEIHIRISNPDSLSYCPWGKTLQRGDLLAARIPSIDERAKFLDIESLAYTTIPELADAIGLPLEELCVDCDLQASE